MKNRELLKQMSLVFSAGCMGALANSLAVWLFGKVGITTALGVKIAPVLTPDFLYPRIVWGGIWGLLFLLPFIANRTALRGLTYSIGPTLVQLFIVFPIKANKGFMGFEIGMLTPVFVIIFNGIWGVAAAYWLVLTNNKNQILPHSNTPMNQDS
jgi:hypothetical protein